MRKILILIGMLCLLFACNRSKSSEGLLTASLENIPDGTILNVVDIDSGTLFKRITVFDKKFEFAFNFPTPRKIGIWEDKPQYDKYRLILWLENSKINITGNYDYFVNAKIVGSTSNIIHEQFKSLIRKFDNRLSDLEMSGRMTNNQVVKDSISREVEQVHIQYKDEKMHLYLKHIESDVAFYNLAFEIVDYKSVLSRNDIAEVYNELPDKFKLLKKGEMLKEYISLPEIPKVGEKFVDCSQFTPDGKTESISSQLGKYTIVEFWASGCGPCRAEHPNLRKIFNLYHEKGLNIISISGDTDSDDWKNAIKKDSLTWTNISDLRGFNNEAFMIYGIKSIPQMLLLDENGIIIDDKLAQKSLEHEIEIRFNHLIETIGYGQSNYFILPNDTIYNEIDFNLHFKTMVKALPKDYSLTPIIYHKYHINDSIINYVTFKEIWWGDKKVDQSNFKLAYKQDPLFLNLHKKLPEFTLIDLSGKSFNSSQLMGKPTLITFWSIGCKGCIIEFPQLDKLREKYGDRVNFIAIGFDSRDILKGFLKKKPLSFYHLANGNNYAMNILKMSGIPENFFLDKNGYIREIKTIMPLESNKFPVGAIPKLSNREFDKILEKLTKL